MSNVEDAERIRIALDLLQKQYAACRCTSDFLPQNSLRVTFHTSDQAEAAERAAQVRALPKAFEQVYGLEAHIRGPIFLRHEAFTEGLYMMTVTLRCNDETASPPKFLPPGLLTDRCVW